MGVFLVKNRVESRNVVIVGKTQGRGDGLEEEENGGGNRWCEVSANGCWELRARSE